MMRRTFTYFTIFFLLLTAMMAINNVLIDDAGVRALAKKTAADAAGCGDGCRMSGFRGDRGMINETIEYDFDPQGHYVVQCHRKMLAVGDYVCIVTEGKRAPKASSSATPQPSH